MGMSPRSEYSEGTMSPRGVIKQMQKKYVAPGQPSMQVAVQQRCRNSRQTLLARGTKISDFCPLCKLHGVLCAVSVHRIDMNFGEILFHILYSHNMYETSR
jgi:hypothetical protein